MPDKAEERFWVGVASREHVRAAVEGGFCQLNHGKAAPVQRLRRGDVLVFYSPRERMGASEALQAFTAVGEIGDDVAFQVQQGDAFRPFRRKVRYFAVEEASIHPLLKELSFTKDGPKWGMAFRRGTFQISRDDYRKIAVAMQIKNGTTQA